MQAPLPPNESERLAALRRQGILDTPPEPGFERLTRLAARVLEMPISLVTLVDGHRQWFKSRFGFNAHELPRELSLCAHAILSDAPLVVPDLLTDPRFLDNPLVTAEPRLRFYAGVALKSREGLNIGTFCVLDTRPREFGEAQRATLKDLGAMAADELDLRLSTRQLHEQATLLELAHDAVIVRDAEDRITYWNRAAERLYGWTKAEALGQAAHTLLQTRFPTSFEETECVLRREGSWEGELTHTRRDNTRVIVASRQALRRDEHGHLASVLELNGDLTGRRHAEEAARVGEEKYRQLWDTCTDAVLITDQESRIVSANPALETIFGYRPDELVGQEIGLLQPERLREAHRQSVERYLAGGGHKCGWLASETVGLHRDGREFPIDLAFSHLQAGAGQHLFAACVRDITERKRVEQRLAENERQLRDLIENATDNIFKTDASGHFTFFNATAPRLMKCGLEDLLGKHFLELIHPDYRAAAARFYGRQLVRKIENTYYEYPTVAPDGTVIWFGQQVRLLLEDGQPAGFQAVARDITERKHAEDALRDSEERFRQLTENIQDVFWMASADSQEILYVSPAYETLWGRSAEELRKDPLSWVDAVHEADRPRVVAAMQNCAVNGEYEEEYRVVHPDGTIRWVQDRAFPVRDASGKIYRRVGFAADITQRKRGETEMQRVQSLLTSVVENLPHMLFLKDAQNLQFAAFNKAGEDLLGVSRRDLLGLSDHDLLPPAEAAAAIARDRAVLASKALADFPEEVVQTPNGIRFLHIKEIPLLDAEGNPQYLLGLAEDITPRKVAEEELDRFYIVAVDLFCSIDFDGFLLRFNPAWERTFGYTSEELTSGPIFQFLHPEDHAATEAEMQKLRVGHDSYSLENRYRCKDGTYKWLSWSATSDLDTQIIYATAQDVTQRKLGGEILQRAKEEAERANAAKSEFLSRMSHELRTPLNAILGFGQLLELDDLTEQQHRGVDLILKGGRHLLDLINEVLDFEGIESGRMLFSPEPVLAREVLLDVLDLVQPLAAQRNVSLDPRGFEEACDVYVHADRQRLKQVLLNLLSNAIKYNRDAGRVTVDCARSADGECLRLQVSDTGAGIAPEHLSRLFVAFDRLGVEHTQIEGTGLGLALSKRLVAGMGGSLGVKSTPGVGSTFWLELPLAEHPAVRHEPLPPGLAAAPGANHPTRTVLYIEDNLSNLELVEHLLRLRPGLRLLTAMQGGLGLELAREHRPDLILLDLHLPDVSGREVLLRLRAEEALRGVKIIILSADATPGQVGRLSDAGADGYLSKPFDVRKFLQVLDEALQPPRAAARPPG